MHIECHDVLKRHVVKVNRILLSFTHIVAKFWQAYNNIRRGGRVV